jgi:hypothetical protein
MSNATKSREIKGSGPEYVGWRGELLTELALTRLAKLAEVEIFRPAADQGYDFIVSTPKGRFMFIQTKGFSSNAAGIKNPAQVDELRWRVPKEIIKKAQESRSPVLLFLFDADTDHGRFLRLDTLTIIDAKSNFETLIFPRQNTINEANLLKLLVELE